jgi:hypothetical protein
MNTPTELSTTVYNMYFGGLSRASNEGLGIGKNKCIVRKKGICLNKMVLSLKI